MDVPIEELLKSGQTLLNTGNPKEAMTMYEKVLEISPMHIDSLIKKGNILGKLGKYDNAIIYYDRVLEQENQNMESGKTDIGWGHQIRSYILQPYRLVKDNRTNFESTNPDKVLDGEIDEFLEQSLYQTK